MFPGIPVLELVNGWFQGQGGLSKVLSPFFGKIHMLVSVSKALRSPALKRPLSNVVYSVKCLWTGISFSHLRFVVVLTLTYQQGTQPIGCGLFEEVRHSLSFPGSFYSRENPLLPV